MISNIRTREQETRDSALFPIERNTEIDCHANQGLARNDNITAGMTDVQKRETRETRVSALLTGATSGILTLDDCHYVVLFPICN